jgi:hypothetical protein
MKRSYALVVGIALIVLTNAIALGGVWWNRAAPESTLTLSERELGLPWRSLRNLENSGLALTLRWRVASQETSGEPYNAFGFNGGTPGWLDAAKLQALGFEIGDLQTDAGQRRFTRQQPRPAILVLELDGPARQAALAAARDNAARHAAAAEVNPGSKEFAARAKAAQDALVREENSNSRLFAIDAGADARQLRQQYPDKSRYLLLAGTVRPDLHHPARGARPQPSGRIASLGITQLHVPHALSASLDGQYANPMNKPETAQRFTATIAVGQRLEPWIVDLHAVERMPK